MSEQSDYQYRVIMDRGVPGDWPWEDDRSLVEEEADAFRALGETGVRIETRLRPIPGNRGDWEITWQEDRSPCPVCDGRGWHTAGGNDPMACGRCPAGEAFVSGQDEESR